MWETERNDGWFEFQGQLIQLFSCKDSVYTNLHHFTLQNKQEQEEADLDQELRKTVQDLENEKTNSGRKNSFLKQKKVKIKL